MVMMIRYVLYVLKQAFVNLWRNRTMTIASITSVTATLLILGVIFLLIVNISNLGDYASDQFDVIQVFLDDDLTIDEMRAVGDKIEAIDKVSHATFETKEQALEKMKQEWSDHSQVLTGLEERNPLPNSYIVQMDNLVYSDHIVRLMNEIEGIDEIKYYRDVIVKINSITQLIRNIGLTIIFILLFVSTFVISNTIKLAVTSRKNEIQIMKYVGATHWFIRWPFIFRRYIIRFLWGYVCNGINIHCL